MKYFNQISTPIDYYDVSIHLVQVDFIVFEPLSDEDNDGPAKLVMPALIQAANARDLSEILRFGPTKQPLVPTTPTLKSMIY